MPFQIETWMVHYRHRQLPIFNSQWDVEIKHKVEAGREHRRTVLPGCCSLEKAWQRAESDKHSDEKQGAAQEGSVQCGWGMYAAEQGGGGRISHWNSSWSRSNTIKLVPLTFIFLLSNCKDISFRTSAYHVRLLWGSNWRSGLEGVSSASLCLEVSISEVPFQSVQSSSHTISSLIKVSHFSFTVFLSS